jgi:hypothetical protein
LFGIVVKVGHDSKIIKSAHNSIIFPSTKAPTNELFR